MEKLRSRLVNFRVTDEEFQRLKSACNRYGSRGLSDYARAVMFAPEVDPTDLGIRMIELERRLSGLEASMSHLVNMLLRVTSIAETVINRSENLEAQSNGAEALAKAADDTVRGDRLRGDLPASEPPCSGGDCRQADSPSE